MLEVSLEHEGRNADWPRRERRRKVFISLPIVALFRRARPRPQRVRNRLSRPHRPDELTLAETEELATRRAAKQPRCQVVDGQVRTRPHRKHPDAARPYE